MNIECRSYFNPIQDGPFWDCSQMGEAKKYIYPTMMKLRTSRN